MKASYDAARHGTDLDGHWAHADRFDADSANSKGVRETLVSRSRYETGSNGYYAGIMSTHADMLVGIGPSLRLLTKNTKFNQWVEREFAAWMQATGFRRKLWCAAHAKTQDGEAIGMLQYNPAIRHSVKLDVALIETEQCQTPMLEFGVAGRLDGVQLDKYGNVESYDVLPVHPGSSQQFLDTTPDRISARNVLHFFKQERPGQHRGTPALKSTLNIGASRRRWREATVAAGETAADFAAVMSSDLSPAGDDERQAVAAMTSLPIPKRSLLTLPHGWQATQMKAEFPVANGEAFQRGLVSEQARPLNMPFNLAACDSSTYSFASGKLDFLAYRAALDVERQDIIDTWLERLFDAWWKEFTILDEPDDAQPPPHQWDFPAHPIIDVVAETTAIETKLKNGTTTLRKVYADAGMDLEDELQVMAQDYGVTVDEMRAILLRTNFPAAVPPAPPTPPTRPALEADLEYALD